MAVTRNTQPVDRIALCQLVANEQMEQLIECGLRLLADLAEVH